jgi:hypothetical protein
MAWADELRDALRASEASLASLTKIHAYLWAQLTAADCLPRELPRAANELLEEAHANTAAVKAAVDAAFRRYSSEPVETLFRRRPLGREQYFLLCAMGATQRQLPVPEWLAIEEAASDEQQANDR